MANELEDLLLNHSRVLYVEFDENLKVCATSSAMQERPNLPVPITGASASEIFQSTSGKHHELKSFKEYLENTKKNNQLLLVPQLNLRQQSGEPIPMVAYSTRWWKDRNCFGVIFLDNRAGVQIARALLNDDVYPSLKEDLPLSIIQKDSELTFRYVNHQFCHEEGVKSRSEIYGTNDFHRYPHDMAERFREIDRRVLSTNTPTEYVEFHHFPNRPNELVHTVKRPLLSADGNSEGVEIAFWRVHERDDVLLALHRAREQFYRDLLDKVPLNIYRKDKQKRFIFGNSKYAQHIGRTRQELASGTITDQDLFPKELWQRYERDDDQVLSNGIVLDTEEEHSLIGERNRSVVRVIKSPLQDVDEGETFGLQGIFWDVTEYADSRERLEKEIAELNTLLKQAKIGKKKQGDRRSLLLEIHHRVYNNLQELESLLVMAAAGVIDSEARSVILDCVTRINTMASVHEALYKSKSLASVDLAQVTRDLVERIVEAHSRPGFGLETSFSMKPAHTDADTAMYIGLIATEITLNALKHAFRGKSTGRLHVEIDIDSQIGFLTLLIVDDGVGIADEPSRGLGTSLIGAFVRQLKASLTVIHKEDLEWASTGFQINVPYGSVKS